MKLLDFFKPKPQKSIKDSSLSDTIEIKPVESSLNDLVDEAREKFKNTVLNDENIKRIFAQFIEPDIKKQIQAKPFNKYWEYMIPWSQTRHESYVPELACLHFSEWLKRNRPKNENYKVELTRTSDIKLTYYAQDYKNAND